MKCGTLVIGGGICHPQPTTLSQGRQGEYTSTLSTTASVANFFPLQKHDICILHISMDSSINNTGLGSYPYEIFYCHCERCLCWCRSLLVTLLSPSFSIGPARRHIRQPRPRPNPTKPRRSDTTTLGENCLCDA